jgi:IS30 family transposase
MECLFLLLKYLPKKMDFQPLTQCDIQGIMDKLNNRHKKCLGFKTPNYVFFGIKPPVALAS